MYPNYYQNSNNQNIKPYNGYSQNMNGYNQNDDRLIAGGGFLGPFILGGITGGLLAPAFTPRPYYNNNYYPYPNYYYYGGYYR